MTTLHNATEVFGSSAEGLELHSFPVRSMGNATGTGYWIGMEVDNTRRVYTLYRICIIWDNGDVEYSTAESEQELKLWTEHLQ